VAPREDFDQMIFQKKFFPGFHMMAYLVEMMSDGISEARRRNDW
jgi:hypothetical protein